MDLASSGGYDAVQMRDVAATAHVALGTIYRYFSSKDHLLAATLVEWTRDLQRRGAAAPRPPSSSGPGILRGGGPSVRREATRRSTGSSTSSVGPLAPWSASPP